MSRHISEKREGSRTIPAPSGMCPQTHISIETIILDCLGFCKTKNVTDIWYETRYPLFFCLSEQGYDVCVTVGHGIDTYGTGGVARTHHDFPVAR